MSGRVWTGVFLLIIGIGFFMHQAELLDFKQVLSTWWPLIFIVIGIVQLVNRTYSSAIPGLLFISVGALLLFNGWFDFNLTAYIWPLIIIFIGLVFIFSRASREKIPTANQDINSFSLFSGAQIRNQSDNFVGGTVTAVFGGAEIDLREAHISERGAKLDFTSVFGGIELKVPENVHVEISGVPVFGGWENKTRLVSKDADHQTIKLNCLAIFGGVEVRN